MNQTQEHAPKQAAIDAWIQGRLSPAGSARLQAHLDQCTLCRDIVRVARAYRESVQSVQALSVPELPWERISEHVLTASVPPPPPKSRRRSNARTVGYPLLAVAAALALYLLPQRAPSTQTPTTTSTPASAAMVAQPAIERAPQQATVVAIMGTARLGESNDAVSLTMATPLSEGTTLVTEPKSTVDVLLDDSSRLRVGESTVVFLQRLRHGDVQLALAHGSLAQQVSPLAKGDQYRVAFADYQASVLGTLFAVQKSEGPPAVQVQHGQVQVSHKGTPVATVGPSSTWHAGTDAPIQPSRAPISAPFAFNASTEAGIAITLPAYPGAKQWIVDGTPFPFAESLSLRLPVRAIALGLLLENGHTLTATWTPKLEASHLSLEALHKLLKAAHEHPGHLSAEQLQQALAPGQHAWQRCFEHALKTEPELRPSLTMRVELTAMGKVHRTALAGDLDDRDFQHCLDRATRGLRFPAPGGPLTFEVPLSFRHRMP